MVFINIVILFKGKYSILLIVYKLFIDMKIFIKIIK